MNDIIVGGATEDAGWGRWGPSDARTACVRGVYDA